MKPSRQPLLPPVPLLRAYVEPAPPAVADLEALPGLGPRVRAVHAAGRLLLSERFVDGAREPDFTDTLVGFYQATVQPALHTATVRRRAGLVRHGLGHLLRCRDPLPRKLERVLAADGPYHIASLGPAFWSAVAQGLDPVRHPSWLPGAEAGLRRLGLANWQTHDPPATVYAALLTAYAHLRELEPRLTALHLDHFLSLVAVMRGRNLGPLSGEGLSLSGCDLPAVIRQERARVPVRRRLKERGDALASARRLLEAALAAGDGPGLGAALALADPAGAARAPVDWKAHAAALTLWVGRFWQADDPDEALAAFWQQDPIPGAGLWLPAAVLHLRDARRFHPWDEVSRQGFAVLDDSATPGDPPRERYRLFHEGLAWLREQHRLHPLEAPAVLAAVAAGQDAGGRVGKPSCTGAPSSFGGFCADTFRFLEELVGNNHRAWMERQRGRYRFAVQEPLAELCRCLVERYVEPVLRREHGWDLETAARSGRALTSIVKNDYGRSAPYQTVPWITFHRKDRGKRHNDVQLFVRLDAAGLCYGLRLGREARETGRLFRKNVQVHAELLHRALADSGALGECLFGDCADGTAGLRPASPGDLRTWAIGRELVASKRVPRDATLLTADELVGDILLTFDRLLPAYACAVLADPEPFLTRRTGPAPEGSPFSESDFCRATFLERDWLERARSLLDLKRQLILQGVPGTGKTHVARLLARYLTAGREEAVRLVQFHPAYSYEEFVEGIKVKSVEVDGRHDVTYPVEEGLLCAFATEAAKAPSQPHVLIIDEINRGNLPRVFGELLYLLEYRDQAVGLPYSRRGFRLPPNLYLLGTMNAADRSVALVDQALRRRFSFLEMPPDAAVLADWLRTHPPAAGPNFAATVVTLFERLNACLLADLGPNCQIGHSYFMVPDLDEARLQVVWRHHVRPLLEEYFAGHAERAAAYEVERLLREGWREPGGAKRKKATRISG
jgi:5-methylcytosine-specific restriction protein B